MRKRASGIVELGAPIVSEEVWTSYRLSLESRSLTDVSVLITFRKGIFKGSTAMDLRPEFDEELPLRSITSRYLSFKR